MYSRAFQNGALEIYVHIICKDLAQEVWQPWSHGSAAPEVAPQGLLLMLTWRPGHTCEVRLVRAERATAVARQQRMHVSGGVKSTAEQQRDLRGAAATPAATARCA